MSDETFWAVIAIACRSDPRMAEQWDRFLVAELKKLPPDEIIAWDRIFDRLAAKAYTVDLWGAAYLINGGASDDGFYYFRCWLICMGRDVYEAALADPDSLADVVDPTLDAEAEPYGAAPEAWAEVTGKPEADFYTTRYTSTDLRGEDWDFDDDAEVRRRVPRLAAIYLE